MTGIEKSEFEKVDDKLVLSKSYLHIPQPSGDSDFNTEIFYDTIGKILFPKHILSQVSIQMNGSKQEAPQVDVYLDACTIE